MKKITHKEFLVGMVVGWFIGVVVIEDWIFGNWEAIKAFVRSLFA
jgi:hypothetical protein